MTYLNIILQRKFRQTGVRMIMFCLYCRVICLKYTRKLNFSGDNFNYLETQRSLENNIKNQVSTSIKEHASWESRMPFAFDMNSKW